MTKSEILKWYCDQNTSYAGCHSCRSSNYSRRDNCNAAKQLETMIDKLIDEAPDTIRRPYVKIPTWNDHCIIVTEWKQEAKKND